MTVVLYLGNLPLDTTSDEVAALVEAVASVETITLHEPTGSRDYCRAEVEIADRDLTTALAALRAARLRGRRVIVQPARAERTG